MSFLAPLFLVGALTIGLPVIFHLIRRTTRERKVFSSLMFLQPSPPRLTRKSRLEHILLLIARCAVLCLLAVAFARPFLKKAVSDDAPKDAPAKIVVLVDASASMRRAGLWDQARSRLDNTLKAASAADQVAIYTFDRQSRPVISFEEWNALPPGQRVPVALQKFGQSAPGWAATQLGPALISAAEALGEKASDSLTGPRRIVVISDLHEGSRVETLQGYDWPRGVQVAFEPLKPRHPDNAGLQLVADTEDADSSTPVSVRMRVSNSAGSRKEQFRVAWAQGTVGALLGQAAEVYVPAGRSRVVTLPAPPVGTAPDRVLLQGDDEDFDNTVFVLPPEPIQSTVLYLGGEKPTDSHEPLYFLLRAFQDTRHQRVQVLARPPANPLQDSETKKAELIMVTGAIPDSQAAALRALAQSGKTVLVIPPDANAGPGLARLLGLDRLEIAEGRTSGYVMLSEIDFRHPLFAPFADPRFSDFTRIHFWKFRKLDAAAIPASRVVAKFDSGDPAILEVPAGKGRVIIMSSGFQPEESQLALSTKFVPMLYSLLEQSASSAPPITQYLVGDVVNLPPVSRGAELQVLLPDGTKTKLSAGQTNFTQTTMPGIYALSSGQGQPAARWAINVDPRESRTAPIAADEFERLGVPSGPAAPSSAAISRQVNLKNTDLESRQKLWRWCIIATLTLLLFESWLAGRTARRTALAATVSAAP